ncbi:MAG: DUF2791 family P-loop domain-containing protein [Euryarchaeota archaeon]|nr:DUF2791 family P-loop domain-containing protein [Euryarchaeota archaeon]MDE1835997.1 DUF2791 family P-loop domain-containing protein [Euryarchaeota archaeon]MDE1880961.1 DUF2791 family P-loop domain-containing protein [Euryarchaeota archaeon]MDE2046011.1 DUF2791 family P-loop domain-containing protein [Thermoplasmata archaeon]
MRAQGPAWSPRAASELPFVGRTSEREVLSGALKEVARGRGACWIVEGPGGIGKTRLARWAEELAEREGFRVRRGSCLEESLDPFFPWAQVFRRSKARRTPLTSAGTKGPSEEASDRPPTVRVWTEEGSATGPLRSELAGWSGTSPTLLVTRDRPSTLRERLPQLSSSATVLWLSRVEGPDSVLPGRLDELGERLEKHFRSEEGSIVAIEGLEYLSSQNGFGPVLSLLQFLRDVAQETGGHLLLSMRPAAFEPREAALLSTLDDGAGGNLGRGVQGEGSASTSIEIRVGDPPSLVWMRLLDALEKEAEGSPVMISLDDLQWADPASVRAVQFLVRNLRESPVLLLATLRTDLRGPVEGREVPVVEEVLSAMEREGLLRRLHLQGVDALATEQLLEAFFEEPLATPGVLDELLQRTAGNPYFVLSSARMLFEEGRVTREEGRSVVRWVPGEDLRVPEDLRRTVERRLARLGPQEREVLERAAILGQEFDPAPVAATRGGTEGELFALMERLGRDGGFLRRVRGGDGRWSFDHPLTCAIVRANSPQETTRERAKQLAGWWAAHLPEEVEHLARLYHAASSPLEGLPWVRRAIEQAVRARDAERVELMERWLQDLLQVSGAPKETCTEEGCRVLRSLLDGVGPGVPTAERMAEGLVLEGVPGKALRKAEILRLRVLASRRPDRALEELARIGAEVAKDPEALPEGYRGAFAAAHVRLLTDHLHREEEAIGVIDATLAVLPPGTEGEEREYLQVTKAWCLGEMGRFQEAEAALGAMGPLPSHGPYTRSDGRRIGTSARLDTLLDRYREASELYRRSAEAFRETGDVSNLSTSLYNVASALSMAGELSGAERALEELGALAKKFDLRVRGATSVLLAAEVHGRRTGDWEGAGRLVEEAREQAQRAGYAALAPYCDALGASALLHCGKPKEAFELLERIGDGRATNLPRELQVAVHIVRAQANEALGNATGSLEELRRLRALEEGPGASRLGRARVASLCAQWEERHGEAVRADEEWKVARTLFEECQLSQEARAFYSWWPSG